MMMMMIGGVVTNSMGDIKYIVVTKPPFFDFLTLCLVAPGNDKMKVIKCKWQKLGNMMRM